MIRLRRDWCCGGFCAVVAWLGLIVRLMSNLRLKLRSGEWDEEDCESSEIKEDVVVDGV